MFVFEITTPGTRLDYEDREWSSRIQELLRNIQSQFVDASVALNLFIQVQAVRSSGLDRDSWARDAQRRSEIAQQVERERGGGTLKR